MSLYPPKRSNEESIALLSDRLDHVETELSKLLNLVADTIMPPKPTDAVSQVEPTSTALKPGVVVTKNGRYMLNGRMIKATEAFL